MYDAGKGQKKNGLLMTFMKSQTVQLGAARSKNKDLLCSRGRGSLTVEAYRPKYTLINIQNVWNRWISLPSESKPEAGHAGGQNGAA